MKVFVHLNQRYNVPAYINRFSLDLEPDITPYGFHYASEMGCEVSFSVTLGRRTFVQRLVNRVLGFDFVHALRNRRAVRSADIVWTMSESEYLSVVALSLFRRQEHRPKVVAQSIWLFDNWTRLNPIHRAIAARLLRRVDVFTVHTQEYVSVVRTIVPDADVRVLPFGVSRESFPIETPRTIAKHTPIRIFAPGTDRTRDWDTLLAALGNDDRFEIVVISGSLAPSTVQSYSNLTMPSAPSISDFRHYYRWADFVLVPMVPNRYSGITVALEAASMGTPVVCSRTGGVPTYFDEHEILYVPPLDPPALREAILSCSNEAATSRAARATQRVVARGYSSRAMAKRYVELSRDLFLALLSDAATNTRMFDKALAHAQREIQTTQ